MGKVIGTWFMPGSNELELCLRVLEERLGGGGGGWNYFRVYSNP